MVNRNKLRIFFAQHSLPHVTRQLMNDLEPFFQIAETGKYMLRPDSPALQSLTLSALRSFLGRTKAAQVVTDSLACPFPKGQVEIAIDPQKRMSKNLSQYFDRVPREREIYDMFWDCLYNDLWKVLVNIEYVRREYLLGPIGEVLYCYIVYSLEGKTRFMRRIRPLVHLLPKAIPIGEKDGQPDVWYLLVA